MASHTAERVTGVPSAPKSPERQSMTATASDEEVPSPLKSEGAQARSDRQQRHSKRLSLNFPILVPARNSDLQSPNHTASPATLSSAQSQSASYFSAQHSAMTMSSSASPLPLTPPSESSEENISGSSGQRRPKHERSKSMANHARQDSSSEFLVQLASQERRVMELKEELAKAENDLVTLKRQWALHEASKKKGELKNGALKMGHVPTRPSHNRAQSMATMGLGLLVGEEKANVDEDPELERERMRELAKERLMGRRTTIDDASESASGKRKVPRVFSNSKHARALSLLNGSAMPSPTRTTSSENVTPGETSNESSRKQSIESPTSRVGQREDLSTPNKPSLSRQNSGFDALSLGKTYKELANAATAGRKSLPQGLSPELFVKQGRQMVGEVRDGLWTFFEDIRQATVGDVDELAGVHNVDGKVVKREGQAKRRSGTDKKESSFWSEFGVDTPKTDKTGKPGPVTRTKSSSSIGRKVAEDADCPKHGHHGKKSAKRQDRSQTEPEDVKNGSKNTKKEKSTKDHASNPSTDSRDSRNPPSLLDDLLDEEDESWDNWESGANSPVSLRKNQTGFTDVEPPHAKKAYHTTKDGAVQWKALTR